MRTALLALATVAAAALVAGCLETKQDVTVNPDGSGKTRVEIVMSDMPFSMTPQQDPPDPQVTAKRLAKSVLEKSKGVDAWADVAFERTEDNRTRFAGTAYFRDFAAMNLQAGKMKGVTLEKTADGGMVLQVETQQQAGPLTGGRETSLPQATEPEKPMSEEQTQQRLAAERAKWQQMKPMMAMTLGRMKMEATFHLPGTLKEVQGFVDKLMADDEYVRKNMLAGKGGMGQPPLDDKALQQLFGTAGPLVAKTAGPAKPQFDYAAEVQAAKAAYPAMIQRLGLDQVPADQPGPQVPPGFGLPGGA